MERDGSRAGFYRCVNEIKIEPEPLQSHQGSDSAFAVNIKFSQMISSRKEGVCPPPTAKKKSACLSSLQNFPATPKHPTPQRGKPAHTNRGKRKSACSSTPQNLPAVTEYLNSQGVSLPAANRKKENQPVHPRRKIFQPHRSIPPRKG